ncbi:MAG: hypothetical protein MUD03_00610 [Pirellula sp.]|nr:hypothetical protein [Pirellula sp.]
MGTRRISSLRNRIRTHGTRHLNENQERHELYMRLTILEIERNRRESEKRSLIDRLSAIDQRLESVQAEQTLVEQLLEKLSPEKPGTIPARSGEVFRY